MAHVIIVDVDIRRLRRELTSQIKLVSLAKHTPVLGNQPEAQQGSLDLTAFSRPSMPPTRLKWNMRSCTLGAKRMGVRSPFMPSKVFLA